TTRPETMLGDTAVAVNPKDKRYKRLIGKTLILPLVNREIKIIADPIVDMRFGTGAVKVTPAHDPNDYLLGKKHHLDFINVMSPDGRMNENAGAYKGMDRFEARQAILKDLKDKGLLEKIQPHQLSAGHCYRCQTIIEPYLSKQWFVKMRPLAKPAIEAVKKKKIRFYPKRWEKVYLHWMENIQDWCISRQIWWGHRLPVYYCRDCQNSKENQGVIVSKIKPERCSVCGSTNIYQDEDVLDTWFSSWLWPFATFGWPFQGESYGLTDEDVSGVRVPAEELKYFYPTSVLVTASEIIFFWVARMIMAGLEFMGEIPFRDVYIHGTVRDTEGKKMSKSLGNIIDPLDIIEHLGADALRFSLISLTSQGQDVFLSAEKFNKGRNFSNKVWNASRFILMHLEPKEINVDLCVFFKKEKLDVINRWILSRFYSSLRQINKMLDNYRFNEAANILYGFFWHEFCDWYLELIKPILENRKQSPEYRNIQVVMYKVLEKFLKILHPFMPFISEEIWQRLPHQGKSIMLAPWPHIQEQIIDIELEKKMELVFTLISQIRNIRSELEIPTGRYLSASVSSNNSQIRQLIDSLKEEIKYLARLNSLDIEERFRQNKFSISSLIKDLHLSIPLAGIVDIEKERLKLNARIQETESQIRLKQANLKNKDFLKKAPVEVVEKEKMRLKELTDILSRLKEIKNGLQ
ncbi:MAG: valine--tRNA ligase, partial [Candidatus Omnitrophica bacterium]|nr:valine--tRNA ligase [Candidatus Omnitrophota bacterium]